MITEMSEMQLDGRVGHQPQTPLQPNPYNQSLQPNPYNQPQGYPSADPSNYGAFAACN
jgi:hypothetical protein